eukprot:2045917-Prymnesium_polylepis.1
MVSGPPGSGALYCETTHLTDFGLVSFPTSADQLLKELTSIKINVITLDDVGALLTDFNFAENIAIILLIFSMTGINLIMICILGVWRGRRRYLKRRRNKQLYDHEKKARDLEKLKEKLAKTQRSSRNAIKGWASRFKANLAATRSPSSRPSSAGGDSERYSMVQTESPSPAKKMKARLSRAMAAASSLTSPDVLSRASRALSASPDRLSRASQRLSTVMSPDPRSKWQKLAKSKGKRKTKGPGEKCVPDDDTDSEASSRSSSWSSRRSVDPQEWSPQCCADGPSWSPAPHGAGSSSAGPSSGAAREAGPSSSSDAG